MPQKLMVLVLNRMTSIKFGEWFLINFLCNKKKYKYFMENKMIDIKDVKITFP